MKTDPMNYMNADDWWDGVGAIERLVRLHLQDEVVNKAPNLSDHLRAGGTVSSWLDTMEGVPRGSVLRATIVDDLDWNVLPDTHFSSKLLDDVAEPRPDDLLEPSHEAMRSWEHANEVANATRVLRSAEASLISGSEDHAAIQKSFVDLIYRISLGALDAEPELGLAFARRVLRLCHKALEPEQVWHLLDAADYLTNTKEILKDMLAVHTNGGELEVDEDIVGAVVEDVKSMTWNSALPLAALVAKQESWLYDDSIGFGIQERKESHILDALDGLVPPELNPGWSDR